MNRGISNNIDGGGGEYSLINDLTPKHQDAFDDREPSQLYSQTNRIYTSPDLPLSKDPTAHIRQLERELQLVKTRLDNAKGHTNQDKRDLQELEHHERSLLNRIEELDSTRLTEEHDMSHLRQQVLK